VCIDNQKKFKIERAKIDDIFKYIRQMELCGGTH
jgi:hypothetical protein